MTVPASTVVHVGLERMDELLNLVGELVIHRAGMDELARAARRHHGFRSSVLELVETVEAVSRLTEEIQGKVIQSRMVPIEQLFGRFRPLVRSFERASGKEIDLELAGERTEIDKRVVESLTEPLVHLVRNALDHGIEAPAERQARDKPRRGTVRLSAWREGSRLCLEVTDDGAGVDVERVRQRAVDAGFCDDAAAAALSPPAVIDLLFKSGFSTSQEVTGMSGRGVGLDAARARIEQMGGTVRMESELHRGCRIFVTLPMSLTIIPALVVACSEEQFAIPMEHVHETLRAAPAELSCVDGREVIDLRGQPLPIVRLDRVLELPAAAEDAVRPVVVVSAGSGAVGLMVDRVLWHREIVVKPLARRLASVSGLGGASIAGDGQVFLILDVGSLAAGRVT